MKIIPNNKVEMGKTKQKLSECLKQAELLIPHLVPLQKEQKLRLMLENILN